MKRKHIETAFLEEASRQRKAMRIFFRRMVNVLVFATLYICSVAHATDFSQYDQLKDADRVKFNRNLVMGSMKILNDASRPYEAQKVYEFFTNIEPGATAPDGPTELTKNLGIIRSINEGNKNDPNKKIYPVEAALWVTLKHRGILIPIDQLVAIGATFSPSMP